MDIRASIWKKILAKFAAVAPPQEIVDIFSTPEMLKAVENFRKQRLSEYNAADPSKVPDYYRSHFSMLNNEQRAKLLQDYLANPDAGKAPDISEEEILEAQDVAQMGLQSLDPATSNPLYAPPAALRTRILALLEKSLGRKAADSEDVAEWISKRHERVPAPEEQEPEEKEGEGEPSGTEVDPDELEKGVAREYAETEDISGEPSRVGPSLSKTLWSDAERESLARIISKFPETMLADPNSALSKDVKKLIDSFQGMSTQYDALASELGSAQPDRDKEIQKDMSLIEESAAQMRKNFDDRWLGAQPGTGAQEEPMLAYDVEGVKEYKALKDELGEKEARLEQLKSSGEGGRGEAFKLVDEISKLQDRLEKMEYELRSEMGEMMTMTPKGPTGKSLWSPTETGFGISDSTPEELGEEGARLELRRLKRAIQSAEGGIAANDEETSELPEGTFGLSLEKLDEMQVRVNEWYSRAKELEEYLEKSAPKKEEVKTREEKAVEAAPHPDELRTEVTRMEKLLAQPIEKIFDGVKTKADAIRAINVLRQLSSRMELGGRGGIHMQSLMKRLIRDGLRHLSEKFGKEIADEWTRLNLATPDVPYTSASILSKLLRMSAVGLETLPMESKWEWDAETLSASTPGGAMKALDDVKKAIAEGADDTTMTRLFELQEELSSMVESRRYRLTKELKEEESAESAAEKGIQEALDIAPTEKRTVPPGPQVKKIEEPLFPSEIPGVGVFEMSPLEEHERGLEEGRRKEKGEKESKETGERAKDIQLDVEEARKVPKPADVEGEATLESLDQGELKDAYNMFVEDLTSELQSSSKEFAKATSKILKPLISKAEKAAQKVLPDVKPGSPEMDRLVSTIISKHLSGEGASVIWKAAEPFLKVVNDSVAEYAKTIHDMIKKSKKSSSFSSRIVRLAQSQGVEKALRQEMWRRVEISEILSRAFADGWASSGMKSVPPVEFVDGILGPIVESINRGQANVGPKGPDVGPSAAPESEKGAGERAYYPGWEEKGESMKEYKFAPDDILEGLQRQYPPPKTEVDKPKPKAEEKPEGLSGLKKMIEEKVKKRMERKHQKEVNPFMSGVGPGLSHPE